MDKGIMLIEVLLFCVDQIFVIPYMLWKICKLKREDVVQQ